MNLPEFSITVRSAGGQAFHDARVHRFPARRRHPVVPDDHENLAFAGLGFAALGLLWLLGGLVYKDYVPATLLVLAGGLTGLEVIVQKGVLTPEQAARLQPLGLYIGAGAALFAFLRWSYTGRVMRATAQDREAAAVMGIDTDRVYALTWTIGIACVGVAGVLLAPLYPVYPTAGLQFVLIAYVVVVLGGLGDMAGAVVGSLVVAAVEVVGSYAIGTAWKEVLYFLLFIAVLIARPAGLFGQRGAERLGV